MAAVNLNNVSFSYGGREIILEKQSLEIGSAGQRQQGSVTAIMGSSGCGKTTLLRLVVGLLRPESGQIEISEECKAWSYLPQSPVLFEHLSPAENARYFQNVGQDRARFDEDLCTSLSEKLGIEHLLNGKALTGQLSGGEKQRLVLLRSLCVRPKLLILDEPCSGLDLPVKQAFLAELREIVDQFRMTVLYVTHHHVETRLVADSVVYMQRTRNSPAEMTIGAVSEFASRPPSLDAARVFAQRPINVTKCNFCPQDHSVTVGGVGVHYFPIDVEIAGEHFISFSPDEVKWRETGGIACRRVGSSNQYAFVRLAVEFGEPTTLVGLLTDREFSQFSLEGPATVYDLRGKFVSGINLTS